MLPTNIRWFGLVSWFPFESNLLPEDSYVSGQVSLSGNDQKRSQLLLLLYSGGVHMERVADAVIESGMRAGIAKSTRDTGNAITGAMKENASEAIDIQGIRTIREWRWPWWDIWLRIRQVMTCSRDLITMVGECAKELHTEHPCTFT